MNKKIIASVLFLSLSAFGAKQKDLPRYLPESRIDDEVVKIMNDQDSLRKKAVNRIAKSKSTRDVLGRLTKDTTIYILREELFEKKIPVGIIDLSPRNQQDEDAIEFHQNPNGDTFIRRNGKEISLEEYQKIVQAKEERKKKGLKRTPFIRYENLTAKEIRDLISGPKPVRVFLKKEISVKNDYYPYYVVFDRTGVTGMHSVGAKGDGVGLFFEEAGCPDVSILNTNNFVQVATCNNSHDFYHASLTAKLLQLTSPEAKVVHFFGGNMGPQVQHNEDQFEPKLEIGSYSFHLADQECLNGLYCISDQDLDQHIYEDRLIYFVAAGNIDGNNPSDVYVGSPGKALNAITVGAVPVEVGAYDSRSKWKNSEIRNQKPEIANYSNIDMYVNGASGFLGMFAGTSASTPLSAGMAANILSKNPGLKRHPEVMKSIFLVHATNPITDASSHDKDDLYHVSYNLPYFDVSKGFYYWLWNGSNSDFFNSNGKIVVTVPGVAPGLHCRAAISWLTSGSYAGEEKSLAQDLDLSVYQGSNSSISSSQSWNNPFEVVDFTTNGNGDLRFEIYRFSNSHIDDVVLGLVMACGI